MKTHLFGKTGCTVSVLGFGGSPIGYLKTEQDRVGRILNLMLDAGVNLIDTAANYQGSEELIAKAIGHRRGDYLVVSKCGWKADDIDEPEWSPAMISKTIDRSLRKLGTDHIDIMLLHSCDLSILKRGDLIHPLLKARESGKIRFAGFSGDNEAAAYAAQIEEFSVIETSISIADQANIDHVLPVCRKNNMGVLAKRPIANAAWKDVSEQPGMYKNYARTYTDRLREMKLSPAELGFAIDAWPEIALRFTLGQPGVHCAIIGTTNPDNAQANITLSEKESLPPDTVRKIRAAFKMADSLGTWTGQT